MAVQLAAILLVKLVASLTDPLDLSTPEDPVRQAYSWPLANGTGDDQANEMFHDQRTLSASGTEDLDLAGVLTNAFGDTITFATIKAIIIKAAAGNTNNVNVTRPASNGLPVFLAAGDGIPVKPNGIFVWFAPDTGVAVTAGTGDLLTITNSAGSTGVTYDVYIIGTR